MAPAFKLSMTLTLPLQKDMPFTTVSESKCKHISKQQQTMQRTAVHFLVFVAWIYCSQTDGHEVGENSNMWTRAADTMYTVHTMSHNLCHSHAADTMYTVHTTSHDLYHFTHAQLSLTISLSLLTTVIHVTQHTMCQYVQLLCNNSVNKHNINETHVT